ncbi:dinitrogenase iron-molybdenum cofactor biosynthesis protein [Thermotoga sp. Mc24]|uniref:NifB/NifX family molybdenum-iron cluster-binding protein n=1 Tax=Thermotoga sp. Mc24 TaxID=1231241 RepID=UPI0005421E6E|nr:NifB/NifX family molybdenum-iron cluster-binding protein [Thermotoga sp. Mc24]KHC91431.1 dinitrogenase iron-molybdenum cofactor biosynthesis protein [Thermotoga sp. Mc24]
MSKVAIPSVGKDLSSMVSDRFAKAEYFIIYDTESGNMEVVGNTIADTHGTGPDVVQSLVSKGVEYLIAPNVGRNAFETLKAAGVRVCRFVRRDGSGGT